MATNGLEDMLAVVLAASKDKAYVDAVEKMQRAYRELILADAQARRSKTAVLIRSMARIDAELIRFKRERDRVASNLTPEAHGAIDMYLKTVEQAKKDIMREKNALKLGR